ncbi:ras-related protein rab-5c [Anaeramoeba flamelloides]|uniref:Ras-related protein rab-5c n=1 Tax=Anaeramoeba flamelloides TaxID=1746091 RepID=A0AAV8AEI5_9EUKA|nr:ras-related protein rab-5c [Anaeramoeba flamelloides]
MDNSSEESSDNESEGLKVIKIILLGQSGCGKTSIVLRWIDNSFTENTATTIGASFYLKNVLIGEKMIPIRLWDTSGQERFKSLAPLYYREAAGVILVLDTQDLLSLERLQYWMEEIKKNCNTLPVICLALNKHDLFSNQQQQEIIYEKAEKFAKKINAKFIKTSAKTGLGIDELFENIAKSIVQKHENHIKFRRFSECQSQITLNRQKKKKKKKKCC